MKVECNFLTHCVVTAGAYRIWKRSTLISGSTASTVLDPCRAASEEEEEEGNTER